MDEETNNSLLSDCSSGSSSTGGVSHRQLASEREQPTDRVERLLKKYNKVKFEDLAS